MRYEKTDNDRIVKCYSDSGSTYYIRHIVDIGRSIKIFTCNCRHFQFHDVVSCKHIDNMSMKYAQKMARVEILT